MPLTPCHLTKSLSGRLYLLHQNVTMITLQFWGFYIFKVDAPYIIWGTAM